MRILHSRMALFVAASAAIAAGCSNDHGTGGGGQGGEGQGGEGQGGEGGALLMPPDTQRTESEATLAPKRKACSFQKGAWPAETLGTEFPVYGDIPIQHVIVIVQENRSFDHYLGRLVAEGYYQPGDFTPGGSGFSHSDQLDGPPPGWSNPDGSGGTVVPHADDQHCFTANHGWNDMHADWDDGKNDGFVTDNNPGGDKTFFYEDDTVIPFYYALANDFSLGDRYFASVMSSTWPNRFYLMAATSFGVADNSFDTLDTVDDPSPQIFSLLEEGGHTWKDYTDGPHQVLFFPNFGFQASTLASFADVKCDLMNDIDQDTLPDVAFVMGDEVSETSDEGPSALPGIGGIVVEDIVRHLFASPAWKNTVVFITYDENGGMADHVPPEPACEPDDLAPHDVNGTPFEGKFDHTGFRVPFIVVSPFAKKHFVSHTVYDHASITRFIETRFGLPALTARDANATPPLEMFDFANPPNATPPDIAAKTTVPQAILDQCNQKLAPTGCGN